MSFAPVGIRCPEHATVGPGAKPSAKRQVQMARRRAGSLAAPATVTLVAINVARLPDHGLPGRRDQQPRRNALREGRPVHQLAVRPDQGLAYDHGGGSVTAMFLHGSILHVAFNMFALYWLGTVVEEAIGTGRFLLIYFVSGPRRIGWARCCSTPTRSTVGASGAIFGVMGALLVLEYMTTGSFAGQAAGLILINLVITFSIPNISVGGHLGGLVGGIAATYVLMRMRYVRPAWLGPALAIGHRRRGRRDLLHARRELPLASAGRLASAADRDGDDAGLRERRLRGRQARERDAIRRAAHVVEPQLVTEGDRSSPHRRARRRCPA